MNRINKDSIISKKKINNINETLILNRVKKLFWVIILCN
jgi:hypothetical protein